MTDTSANGAHKGSNSGTPGGADEQSEAADNVIKMDSSENASADTSEEAPKDAAKTQTNNQSNGQVDEWKQRVAYLSAEIENMRKRFARENLEIVRLANEKLLKQLLPVLDNLEFALKAAKDAEAKMETSVRESPMMVNLLKGLEMTLKHFEQTLESIGCSPVKSLGEDFDPNIHEALGQSNDVSTPNNKITGVLQRGFSLAGRVIRPSRVLVNKVDN